MCSDYVMLVVLLVLVVAYFALIKIHTHQAESHLKFGLQKNDNVLLVVSHPDDECLFFSPTIIYLTEKGIKLHVLCLSSGNYYGEGKIRVKELLNSCDNLGVPHDRIYCSNTFEDNPKVDWESHLVAEHIKEHLHKTGATTIFTFDDYGVSGHTNHISVHKGVRHLLRKQSSESKLQAFSLESVHLLRKYIQVVDIFLSLLCERLFGDTTLIASSPAGYYQAYKSMLQHKSQLAWFRKLFVIFSRYMFMNTLKKIA